MTTEKNELIATSFRLDRGSLRELSEAAAIQQTTRTELLRQAVTEILVRWRNERKALLERLIEA